MNTFDRVNYEQLQDRDQSLETYSSGLAVTGLSGLHKSGTLWKGNARKIINVEKHSVEKHMASAEIAPQQPQLLSLLIGNRAREGGRPLRRCSLVELRSRVNSPLMPQEMLVHTFPQHHLLIELN